MVNKTVVHVRIPALLDTTTYLSLIVMSFLGVRGLHDLRLQLILLGLCLTFGLLYHFLFRSGRYEKNPTLYFGSQFIVLALLLLLGSTSIDALNFLYLLLSIHAALVLTRRSAIIWIAIYFLTVSSVVLFTRGSNGFYAIAFYSVTYSICGLFGYILQQAELAREHNQKLVEELQSTQRRLQELAVVEERNRLARELHDSVKQQVFAISMQLSAARTTLSKTEQAYVSVTEAERLAQQAGAELTTLILALRPPGLEHKTLSTALQEYLVEWSRQNGIEVESSIERNPSVTLPVEQVLFRVVQECLANVARHSQASKVAVTLVNENDELVLTIEDNGTGFNVEGVARGVGLDSMSERLATVGGRLELSSQSMKGARVIATVKRT